MGNQKGTILIIALLTTAFLGALAVAVMNPTTAADKAAVEAYNYRRATMAANSAAEQIKYIMCQLDATADMGTSGCVNHIGWVPLKTSEENGGRDMPGVTFPSMDMVDSTGRPVFSMDNADAQARPQTIGAGDYEARFIAFTTTDAAGTAVSYVSAEYEGEVRSMRVNYRRMLQSELPHASYLRALYTANEWSQDLFTFMMQGMTWTDTIGPDGDTWNQPSTGQNGCINIQLTRSKGYLGFDIPADLEIKEGTKPRLKVYCQNVPNNANIRVSLRDIGSPWAGGWMDNDWLDGRPEVSEIEVNGSDIKQEWVEFEVEPEILEAFKGQTMNIAFEFEDTDGNANSAIHFKFKNGNEPSLDYETESGGDSITGNIFNDGNIDITGGDVDGTVEATGNITGEGSGEELPGSNDIPPPDLARDSDWYAEKQISNNGKSTGNPDVIADDTDGNEDDFIAGMICPHTETGENQDYMDDDATSAVTYVLDSQFGQMAGSGDSTYDSNTDSVIVTVPPEYNNKAIYIPGDFWCDILDPTFIDFRCVKTDGSLEPVNLTFIVEGNTYLTDGVNRKKHPDSGPGGLISFISIKNEAGEGGNIFYGDPSSGGGRIDPVKAFMYAENDFLWLPQAQNAGTFDILGNLTASGIADFSNRGTGSAFRPFDLQFDPAILDPEIRENLPGLPAAAGSDIVPGTPFQLENSLYID